LAVSMAGATDIARPAAVATMKRAVAPRTREVRERGGGSVGFERVSIVGVVCGAFDNKVSKRSKQEVKAKDSPQTLTRLGGLETLLDCGLAGSIYTTTPGTKESLPN